VDGPREKTHSRWGRPVKVRKDESRGVDRTGVGDRGCPGLRFSLPLPGRAGTAAAEQEETGVRNLQTPACITARAETCLESGSLPHRETFFLFHRARRIFFLMSQKENGGCILPAKPAFPVPAPRRRENQRLFGKYEKKMTGATVDKGEKIRYNTPAYDDEEDQYPSWRCKENPWHGEKGRAPGGEYTLEPAPQRPLAQ
jgi:hypothetical protein